MERELVIQDLYGSHVTASPDDMKLFSINQPGNTLSDVVFVKHHRNVTHS